MGFYLGAEGRLVDAHDGGIGPRAGAFGTDGADAGGEPGADGLVLDEEAGLADRDEAGYDRNQTQAAG